MMLNSLRLRLILMFMLVVMVAVGTVALVASQATSSDLQVYSQMRDDQQIVSTLLTAYNHHQSQKALQALTEQLARSWHRHIILAMAAAHLTAIRTTTGERGETAAT